MAVRDTSLLAFEAKRQKSLGPDQDAVLAILEEIGPADDLRILEALNQKERVTLKPRCEKRKWTINEVTPRRGELENMDLIEDLGKFKHPSRSRPVHIWRIRGDSRLPPNSWIKVKGPGPKPQRKVTQAERAEGRRQAEEPVLKAMNLSQAGRVLAGHRHSSRPRTKRPSGQMVMFAI